MRFSTPNAQLPIPNSQRSNLVMNRNTAPETQFVNLDSLPLVQKQGMDNGTPLYLIPVSGTDIVRIDFMFNGGAWVQDMPLQAMLAFRLIKEGTASMSVQQINERLDFYGATFSSAVYKTYAVVSIVCLKKHLNPVVDIVRDVLCEPVFDPNSFQIALQQAYANFMIKKDRVKAQAEKLFYETLFGPKHPMAAYEYVELFSLLSPDALRDYCKKCVNYANCRIFLTGGYDENAVQLLCRTFGNGPWGRQSEPLVLSQVKFPASPLEQYRMSGNVENLYVDYQQKRVKFSMTQHTVQSALYAGCVIPKLNGEDRAYMILANMLLGGFFGSRLMNNIREDKGYTYGINSALIANPFFTLFCVQTETANQHVDSVIREVSAEILRIINESPSTEEIDIVKKYYSGSVCRIYEAGFAFTNQLIKKIGVANEDVDTIAALKLMKQATPEQICNVMKRYLNPNNVVWCVAGS